MPEFEQLPRRTQNSHLVRPIQPDRAIPKPARAENPLLAQQQALGNQAVQRLAQSCPVFPSRCPFGGVCHTCPARVQAKLKIGKPGDKYEQEADRVAEQVMRMPEPRTIQRACPECEEEETLQTKPLASQITPLVQRQVEPKEEEEEEPIQAKLAGEQTLQTGPGLEAQIHALRGGGQPLPRSMRSFFEPRFGYDFSRVRVYISARAAEALRTLNARAFTVGSNIVFGAGQYAPGTAEGRRLLAHELTHVVQQGVSSQKVFTSHILSNPTPMIQCKREKALSEAERKEKEKKIAEYRENKNYCEDTIFGGLLHKGKVCFREVVGPCKRGKHVCIDPNSTKKDEPHDDEVSPVKRRKPNGECAYHFKCAFKHIRKDVPRWLRDRFAKLLRDRFAKLLRVAKLLRGIAA
jgi:hypothetical protein